VTKSTFIITFFSLSLLAILTFSLSKSWNYFDKGINLSDEENTKEEVIEKDILYSDEITKSHNFIYNGNKKTYSGILVNEVSDNGLQLGKPLTTEEVFIPFTDKSQYISNTVGLIPRRTLYCFLPIANSTSTKQSRSLMLLRRLGLLMLRNGTPNSANVKASPMVLLPLPFLPDMSVIRSFCKSISVKKLPYDSKFFQRSF
jgi:hypothetical protein